MRGFSSFARNGIHVLKICEQVVTLMENIVARNSFVSPSLNFINTNTSSSLIRSFRFGPNFLGVDLNFRYIVDVVFLAPHQWRILPAVFAKCSYSALKLSLFGKQTHFVVCVNKLLDGIRCFPYNSNWDSSSSQSSSVSDGESNWVVCCWSIVSHVFTLHACSDGDGVTTAIRTGEYPTPATQNVTIRPSLVLGNIVYCFVVFVVFSL